MLEGGKRVGGKADTRKKQKISRSVGGERALPRMGMTQNAGWQNMGNGERKIWHVNMGLYREVGKYTLISIPERSRESLLIHGDPYTGFWPWCCVPIGPALLEIPFLYKCTSFRR